MINRTQDDITKKWPREWSIPIVSIRCITYNHEPYIAKTLNSFLMQETIFPFEIVIHDDASTDKTAEIIREYEQKFPKIIKPIYEIENQYSKKDGSLAKIVNSACNGKYIALCEGDDYWCDTNKLQKQVDFLETFPEYIACVHKCREFNCQTNQFEASFPHIGTEQDLPIEKVILGGGGFWGTNTTVYRREVLQDFRNTYWKLSPVGDYPLALSLASRGKIHYFPQEMSVYRVFAKGSWSSRTMLGPEAYSRRHTHISKMRESLKAFDEYTEKKYTDVIQEKMDLNDFNLYWDFGKWTLLKTTSHYKQRSFIGKLKALYHCLRVSLKKSKD